MTVEDTEEVQDFVFDVVKEFFDVGARKEYFDKREDVQNPAEINKS